MKSIKNYSKGRTYCWIKLLRDHFTNLFQILMESAAAERTAILSELKDKVRTSLRWPPRVTLLVLTGWGAGTDGLREYNSTKLFCSRKTAFNSPWGERIRSKDLHVEIFINVSAHTSAPMINFLGQRLWNIFNLHECEQSVKNFTCKRSLSIGY